MKPHDSLALVYAGAEIAYTPVPFDPTGKLKAKFALEHAGMVDSSGNPLVEPPWVEEDVEEEPAPTPTPTPAPTPTPTPTPGDDDEEEPTDPV